MRLFLRRIKYRKIINDISKTGGFVGRNVLLNICGVFNYKENLIINGDGIDNVSVAKIFIAKDATLTIGKNVGISQTSIYCKEMITIGDYVNIGAGCLIIDSNFHSIDYHVRRDRSLDYKSAKTNPIVIENDVFIGARCIITKGVKIGAHSIVAAGSVVVHDIPCDCIAGGNPCRMIKYINED